MNNMLIPMVVEKSGCGERAYDTHSHFVKDRTPALPTGSS